MESHPKKASHKHLNDVQTALYLDFLLSESRSIPSEKILKHVENCPLCKDKILDLFLHTERIRHSEIKDAIKHAFHPSIIKQTQHTRPAVIKQIAASIFLLAFFVTVYFTVIKTNLLNETPGIRPLSIKREVQIKKTDKSSLSSSETSAPGKNRKNTGLIKRKPVNNQNLDFKINSNLELMINSQTRDETIKVISPGNKAICHGRILFSWETFGIKPVQLKILDNKNEIIFKYSIQGNSFDFNEKLPPGLYYWKLENKNDLLYVGKFFINGNVSSPPE
jgi:hypothetical protein